MKQFFFSFAILFSGHCSAQNILIDSCGLDALSKLNRHEALYFNEQFKIQQTGFDFSERKVGFITGSSAKKIITKKEYFDNWGRSYFKKNEDVVAHVLFLTQEERQNSGGLDAIIISWSKLKIDKKQREKIVQRMNKSL